MTDDELLERYLAGDEIRWIASRDGRQRSSLVTRLARIRKERGIPTRVTKHRHVELTPLQERVQGRYEECMAAGGHRRSGKTVTRRPAGADILMDICRHCAVPFTRPPGGSR